MLRTSVVLSVLFVAIYARTAYICNVRLPGYSDATSEPQIMLGGQNYRFIDIFNAISFNGYTSASGDVEGRLAVKSNVQVSTYTIGYELITTGPSANSQHTPYALVAGRDVEYNGGSIHPAGGRHTSGQSESIYVGGHLTGTSANDFRTNPGLSEGAGPMDGAFNDAQSYYTALSAAFAAQTQTATVTREWSSRILTCADPLAGSYSANVDGSIFGLTTEWIVDNSCNINAQIVINIMGSADVVIGGNLLGGFSDHKILFNIPSARNVNIETSYNGSFLAPQSAFSLTGTISGIVIAGDMQSIRQINILRRCSPPQDTPNPPVYDCPAWEGECAGYELTLNGASYSFKDFNAISFQDFTADTGDVEGRLAVAGNANFGNGYSVGYQLQTTADDRHLPYTLVVGGTLNFGSGEVYPVGNNIPFIGAREDILAQSATTSENLAERVNILSNTDELLRQFSAAQQCYRDVSTLIANQPDNVIVEIGESLANITCLSSTSTMNFVSFTDSQLSQITYYVLNNCQFESYWHINIRGSASSIDLTAGSFPAIAGGLVYNIVGSGRTVNVHDTSLGGHLLAPTSTLNQANGVIRGKVVAGNVAFSLQINRENSCRDIQEVPYVVLINSFTTAKRAGENCYEYSASYSLEQGQALYDSADESSRRQIATVTSVTESTMCTDAALVGKRSVERIANYAAAVYATRSNSAVSEAPQETTMDSSAAVVGFSVIAMIAAALVL